MMDRARRNWAEAQAYRAELLDKRLVLFWSNFRQSAMLQRAGNAARQRTRLTIPFARSPSGLTRVIASCRRTTGMQGAACDSDDASTTIGPPLTRTRT
jgi:hypothetical protein